MTLYFLALLKNFGRQTTQFFQFDFAKVMLAWVFGILIACQSSPTKQFSKVQNGMEKNEVLELMGPPRTATRFHGKDRWIYVFYENDVRMEKEIHFLEGRTTYVGDMWKPEPERSAEAKDQRNADLEAKIQLEKKSDQEDRAKMLPNFENQVHSPDKVRYLPTFTPL